ncbi:FecR family protein [Sulfitobacter sp. HNIBRBA3233]|uniref:FecR family protein n=1 Tax=Sulfitobacter marinivivus TaxID=3158558 RepID=UPI0032DE547B
MFRPLLLCLALFCLPASSVFGQTGGRGICVIVAVEGSAMVSAPGAGRRAAEVGLALGSNATLRTGAGARATLQCNEDLRVLVGPSSQIAVARFAKEAPQTFGMRLVQGIAGFFYDSSQPDGTVQIRTPSAVAAVRSTEWAMRVTDGASAVFARAGAVFVFGDNGRVQLGAGDGVDVSATGAVGPVVQWGQGRIALFGDLLGPDW